MLYSNNTGGIATPRPLVLIREVVMDPELIHDIVVLLTITFVTAVMFLTGYALYMILSINWTKLSQWIEKLYIEHHRYKIEKMKLKASKQNNSRSVDDE